MKNYSQVKNENFLSNSQTFLDSLSNVYFLLLKNHFKSSSFYLGNLLIPIIIVLSLSVMLPITYGFTWIIFITMTFSAFAGYGTLFFTIRKSTMIKNVDMTVNQSSSLYIGTLIVMLTITLITFLVVFFSIIFFDLTNILLHQFVYEVDDPTTYRYIKWLKIDWSMITYYWFTQTILVFAISFFIEKIFSTQKNYFIFALIYLLGGIFFSGIFSSTLYINENNDLMALDYDTFDNLNNFERQGYVSVYLWGQPLWWASQLWPHYGLNQLISHSIDAASYTIDSSNTIIHSKWWEYNIFQNLSKNSLYYLIIPWIWIFIFLFISSILERYKKN
ncbi:MAG: hypothetical protein TYPL_1580 [Candidatus Tyloplasma litorale]|nr:MAG: hypothetical protein TYPL_1580 [Mycoplasmatales bacterium]